MLSRIRYAPMRCGVSRIHHNPQLLELGAIDMAVLLKLVELFLETANVANYLIGIPIHNCTDAHHGDCAQPLCHGCVDLPEEFHVGLF